MIKKPHLIALTLALGLIAQASAQAPATTPIPQLKGAIQTLQAVMAQLEASEQAKTLAEAKSNASISAMEEVAAVTRDDEQILQKEATFVASVEDMSCRDKAALILRLHKGWKESVAKRKATATDMRAATTITAKPVAIFKKPGAPVIPEEDGR